MLPPGAGWIEGPNLYRRGPWYYLLTADGGTGYDHQLTVARSRTLTGPYERDPAGPLITARHHPDLPLQKAGHGSLVARRVTAARCAFEATLEYRPRTFQQLAGTSTDPSCASATTRAPAGVPSARHSTRPCSPTNTPRGWRATGSAPSGSPARSSASGPGT